MSSARYVVKKSQDALGITHEFHGPGMPRYANDVHFLQPPNEWAVQCMAEKETRSWADSHAERIHGFLEAAFEAGREDMKRELRELLGIWGPR